MMQSFKFSTKDQRVYDLHINDDGVIQVTTSTNDRDNYQWYTFTPEEFKAFIKLAGMLVAEVGHD